MQKQTFQEAWDTRTHLLADSLLVQDWPKDLPWHAVAPDSLANEKHLLPVILQLDELSDDHREHVQTLISMKHPSNTAPAMLVRSERSTDALARALAPHVTITLSDESPVLLRFADPQVVAHLLWILPLHALASICEATTEWSIPFQGEWHEMAFSRRPQARWDALDEPRSIALYNVILINRVLARLPAGDGWEAYWRDARKINEWLCAAQDRFELTEVADCVALAEHGMRFGEGFVSHKTIASWLNEARDRPGTYAQKTTVMSTRDWNGVLASA
ncbi:DUF4123 domain-containing protein [Caballeronia novacaledonica]|uniref:DUF4123 domain-containing protein n=1 Tax=Caballeronia novacaledonica TaxID=1544861 RepID=A0AA37I8M9_9BURK|nr:DUF4123 domain-containing protein [Caballeronia novacaledonica]GJH25386.1 DUF4123 domain-containing protein [Caballeronia novacaledonica]